MIIDLLLLYLTIRNKARLSLPTPESQHSTTNSSHCNNVIKCVHDQKGIKKNAPICRCHKCLIRKSRRPTKPLSADKWLVQGRKMQDKHIKISCVSLYSNGHVSIKIKNKIHISKEKRYLGVISTKHVCNLYVQKKKQKQKHTVFIDWMTQHSKYVNTFQA